MKSSTLPSDAPRWRQQLHPDGFGYGWLLLLILGSIAFELAAPDNEWARVVTVGIQGATLLAALRVSQTRVWLQHLALGSTVIAVLGTAGIAVGSGELDDGAARLVGLMLAVLAPAAIVAGIVRQARRDRMITVRTMFGVLCVYVLLGSAFAYGYGLISALNDGEFFKQMSDADLSDFLYFSFVTITTTGYGDLTAATNLGRSVAITEALIGQIYLVTVVAMIVSNLGGVRRSPRRN